MHSPSEILSEFRILKKLIGNLWINKIKVLPRILMLLLDLRFYNRTYERNLRLKKAKWVIIESTEIIQTGIIKFEGIWLEAFQSSKIFFPRISNSSLKLLLCNWIREKGKKDLLKFWEDKINSTTKILLEALKL